MSTIYIGIDPDVDKNGVAWLNVETHKLIVQQLPFAQAVAYCVGQYRATPRTDGFKVIIEAGWLNRGNWHLRRWDGRMGAAAKGVDQGRNEQTSRLLGDIFPSKYKMEWKKLMEMYNAGKITDIYTSAIHSKVMLILTDDGTKITVESSANCNMNPRIEQSCVTVSDELFDFYDYYLHEVLQNEEAKYVTRTTMKQQAEHGTASEINNDERAALLGKD